LVRYADYERRGWWRGAADAGDHEGDDENDGRQL
jgi:hypothetical protein